MTVATLTPATELLPDQITERACVGSLLLARPGLQNDVLRTVQAGDFSDPQCRWVVDIIGRMRAEGETVNAVTLPDWVRRKGLLPNKSSDDFTGSAVRRHGVSVLLHQLTADCPDVWAAMAYAQAVAEAAVRREAEAAASDLAAAADGEDLATVKAIALARLARLMVAFDRVGV